MTEIIHSRQDGAPGRYRHPPSAIRHPPKFGESEYLNIGAEARKNELAHTLAVIRTMLKSKRERGLAPEKILDELLAWMPRHLSKLDTHEGPKP